MTPDPPEELALADCTPGRFVRWNGYTANHMRRYYTNSTARIISAGRTIYIEYLDPFHYTPYKVSVRRKDLTPIELTEEDAARWMLNDLAK
jgi:hypothetical protein